MTTYQNEPHQYQEETLLKPFETQVRFEAKILDADFLITPNRFDEYVCILMPLTMNDNQTFFETGESSLMMVEMRKGQYSRKIATAQYESKNGFIISNQLFKPELNIKDENPHYLPNRDVSITGHFRDLQNGNVVFNIDYADVYEQETRTSFEIDEAENPDSHSGIDW